jgi:acetyl-CoA carboxylase biotin carboxylase subunit
MIRRLFIANRGEIAARVIRSARAMGVETVLATSEIDRDSVPAKLADRAVTIGPSPASESYLKAETLVQAALSTGCDAIHPGYGFLSERAHFAALAEREKLAFVGPTPAQLEAVGDKLRARAEAEAAKVPVAPGGFADNPKDAQKLARSIGAPLLVKAVAGGGGRGMKRVDDVKDIAAAVELASAEAHAAFGDGRVYLERFVERGRHVEVQVLGDGTDVIHLGDRDCSVQRRHQKLIEEAPAPGLANKVLARLHEAAVRFAARLGWRSAGTVEFLVDPTAGAFYFLEMNARIQVEHPVTEALTGLDLVALQLRVAGGEPLGLAQDDVSFDGHAIEARINAEDPAHDFRPSPGRIGEAVWPAGEGLRVDTHIVSGSLVPPFYDSLLGKVIAHAPDRAAALARLEAALRQTRLEGVATNAAFLADVIADREFAKGGVDTGFLARYLAESAKGA